MMHTTIYIMAYITLSLYSDIHHLVRPKVLEQHITFSFHDLHLQC